MRSRPSDTRTRSGFAAVLAAVAAAPDDEQNVAAVAEVRRR
jgi:hypothetical protein